MVVAGVVLISGGWTGIVSLRDGRPTRAKAPRRSGREIRREILTERRAAKAKAGTPDAGDRSPDDVPRGLALRQSGP